MRTLVLILLGGLLVGLPTVSADPAAAAPTPCADIEAVAHRGFHSQSGVSENSAEAFHNAIARGYSIETDVWADADGTLWIFHDRDVSHATGGTGFIDQLTDQQVESLRYLKGGAPLIRFQDAMDTIFVPATTTRVYIEPKQPAAAVQIAAAIDAASRQSMTWVTAFTTYVHGPNPDVQLAEKEYDGELESPESLTARGVDIVALIPDDLTTANVDYYHAGGVEVQDRDSNRQSEWLNTIDAGADGQLTDKPDDFLAYCATGQILPAVTAIDPGIGQPGTSVTVTGTDFRNVTAVSFGGVAASYNVDSSTQITATAPAGMPAQASVVVTTVAGPSDNPNTFRVPPVVTAITPGSGPPGTAVVIDGTTLGEATGVSFAGQAASFTINSATQLTTVVPSGTVGAANLSVTTPGGRSGAPIFFQIQAPASAKRPAATVIPDTTIRSKTPALVLTHSTKVYFGAPGALSYSCRLDDRPKTCSPPRTRLRHLSPGDHTFSVQAANKVGADATPARWKFVVPVDDKQLQGDGSWTRFRAPGAFGSSLSVASTRGATLTHDVHRARRIWVVVTTAPHGGDVQVFLGDTLLKTVSTKGKPRERVVRVAHFSTRRSGTLRLVAGSDARVSVDGFAVSRHR